MARAPSCPHCGEPLIAVENPGADTAPWLSPGCRRGWWNAELTAEARRLWDPLRRVHRGDEGRAVRESASAEREAG